jgi:hypothetical protein
MPLSRAEGVSGWRFWEVVETAEGWRLRSPYWSTDWAAGEPFRAECLGVQKELRAFARSHAAPGKSCRCGIYGGTYGQLQSFLRANVAQYASVPVLGQVSLWGSVEQCANGWRASHAYPLALSVSTLSRRAYDIAASLEAYGVPVEVLDAGETFSAVYAVRHGADRHLTPLDED